ncbi:hypothetical protein F2Q70_00006087 [Brassica cretica]|uniref:Uncharacterized protein n=1 Tax=Brassica cretica TaxID=69181 RepID=A0A8S9J0T5_BRACR|nr:hypothetical protein F2Q70_00006087 [Brassica cretica]
MKTCQNQSPPSFSGRNQSRDAAELRPSEQKNQWRIRSNKTAFTRDLIEKSILADLRTKNDNCLQSI